jgi:EAL domain-containing protein (putative c-di-GMP-specific phosphodiesterase class I)
VPDNAARFLGFAFASADLLFEVDPEGRVVFAMGALQRMMGMDQSQVVGHPWRGLIAKSDHDLVAALVDSLSAADRRGPIKVELAARTDRSVRRYAAFSACRLPQTDPNVSCVLSLNAGFSESDGPPDGAQTKLHDVQSFMAATKRLLEGAQAAGLDLSLDLIQMTGLEEASRKSQDAEAVFRRIAAAMRAESLRGEGAARLGEDQYAVIRNRADKPDYLRERLEKAASDAGADVTAKSASLPLAPELPPLHTMRALKFAISSFLKDGPAGLEQSFQHVLENTVNQARIFSQLVGSRRFRLVYQPIVDLVTGELGHFEALVRLDGDKSPADAIHMAEELELIEELDLAVVGQVIGKINSDRTGTLKLAANVSAKSLMRPGFVSNLLEMTSANGPLANRLMFEITETSDLHDLDMANVAIQRLRQQGFAVALDDFGAGSASMAYLRNLSVDMVKIDGQYVREVAESGRDAALVRHLTKLCDELGVTTIAEMVETQEAAEKVRSIGVRFGQGWRFGRPTPEPVFVRPTALAARRIGAVEGWG